MEYLFSALKWLIGVIDKIWPIAFATFIGAWVAFQLQKHHKKTQQEAAQLAEGRKAQFTIATQLNALKNIRKQYLNPLRDDPDRALKLTPFSVHAHFPQLDIVALEFMLESDGAQLLNELVVSEHMFITLIGALGQRNEHHEMMQRRIAEMGPDKALDQATVQILEDMTNSLYGLADDAIDNLTAGFQKLRTYLVSRFPKAKALDIEFKY
jgi:cbb3-type cytochrome oxidase subunit 3